MNPSTLATSSSFIFLNRLPLPLQTSNNLNRRRRFRVSIPRNSSSDQSAPPTSSPPPPHPPAGNTVFVGGKRELTGIQPLVASLSPPVRLASFALLIGAAIAAGYGLGSGFGKAQGNVATFGGAAALGAAIAAGYGLGSHFGKAQGNVATFGGAAALGAAIAAGYGLGSRFGKAQGNVATFGGAAALGAAIAAVYGLGSRFDIERIAKKLQQVGLVLKLSAEGVGTLERLIRICIRIWSIWRALVGSGHQEDIPLAGNDEAEAEADATNRQ